MGWDGLCHPALAETSAELASGSAGRHATPRAGAFWSSSPHMREDVDPRAYFDLHTLHGKNAVRGPKKGSQPAHAGSQLA